MDEELLKRNTDCVYFLASPFTCKKGVECDYRHSEIARLNPRDCWYWLSGSCLNSNCGFRHPPLDMHTKPPAEVESLPNNSSFPPTKNNVPCYFYFNGNCTRGDKCPFLHGPEDMSSSKQKDSAVVHAPPADVRIPPDSFNHTTSSELLNDKLHTEILNAKLSARIEPVLDAPENFPAAPKRNLKVANEDPFHGKRDRDMSSILARKDTPQAQVYEYEEASTAKSDSPNPSDYVFKSESSICSDQLSDEKFDTGEWLRGFQNLMKERTEVIEDADDQEYMLGLKDCYVDHEDFIIDHSYDDQKTYGGRFLGEKRMHEPFYHSNGVDNGGRKLIDMGLSVGGSCEDLRDHLIKRRFLDDNMERYAEKRARLQRRISIPRFHGRLEGKSFSLPMQKSAIVAAKQRRDAWNSQLNNQRLHHISNRQKFSSNFQRTDFSRRRVSSGVSFTGPKNLGRIKAQKRRVKPESTGFSGQSKSTVDFEAPKPLSEILKDKKIVR